LFFCLDAKERKNQGGELLDGGFFIDAAPFEWSIKFTDSNQYLWPVANAAKASLKTPCSRQPIQGRLKAKIKNFCFLNFINIKLTITC